MQNYKKLKVWHDSHALTLNVYSCTKQFPKEELFSMTSQMRRSDQLFPLLQILQKDVGNLLIKIVNDSLK